jgi:hypothetical protein
MISGEPLAPEPQLKAYISRSYNHMDVKRAIVVLVSFTETTEAALLF